MSKKCRLVPKGNYPPCQCYPLLPLILQKKLGLKNAKVNFTPALGNLNNKFEALQIHRK